MWGRGSPFLLCMEEHLSGSSALIHVCSLLAENALHYLVQGHVYKTSVTSSFQSSVSKQTCPPSTTGLFASIRKKRSYVTHRIFLLALVTGKLQVCMQTRWRSSSGVWLKDGFRLSFPLLTFTPVKSDGPECYLEPKFATFMIQKLRITVTIHRECSVISDLGSLPCRLLPFS